MTARRGALWLLAAAALALLAGRALAGTYADWAFFHAHGADARWRAELLTEAATRLAVLAGAFAFAFANFFAVRQSIVSLVLPVRVGNLEVPEAVPSRRLTLLALGGAVLVALLFGLVDHDWTMVLQAFTGERFAESEPFFERDLGVFVHWLPFERRLFGVSAVLLLVTAVVVVALYASTPSVRWDEKGLYVSAWVRRHLGVLAALAVLLVGWDWRLERLELLVTGTGANRFAFEVRPLGAYDHRILSPYLLVLSFLSAPVAAVLGWSMWRGYLRLALVLVSLVLIGGPGAQVLLPLATPGRGDGAAAAQRRERPYVATNLLYTRRAFGIDRILHPDTAPARRLRAEEAARWVSAWDPAALTRFVERERRGTDVAAFAWGPGPRGLEAVLLRSAPDDAPPGTRWPADRVSAAEVDAQGYPVAVPGLGAAGVPGVLVRPGAARYALVPDSLGYLVAPSFATTLERLALAWDQQNPRLLAADPPQPRPRLLTYRDVRARVTRLAPFLAPGPGITPLVRDDSLYWVLDLFTTSATYPLSQRLAFAGVPAHYVQHAATAVVQAQTGEVLLLPVEAPDPVMRGWLRRFPGLFTPRTRAPGWLGDALPPPADWLLVQGAILGRTGFFGDTTPVRALSVVDDADADLAVGPPTLYQSDAAGRAARSIPVMGGSDDLAGLLTAHGGLAPRVEFTRAGPALRWTSVLERLQAAADEAGIGRALANSRRGRVQAVPTDRGALFVQSFYEWPEDGPPRLAGVAVLTGERTTVGRTLAEALGVPASPVVALPGDVFRARVGALYDAMVAALRAGDWRAYGDAWAALGRLLGRPAP